MKSFIYSMSVIALLMSCKGDKVGQEKEADHKKVEYVYSDGDVKLNVTLDSVPRRAALFTPYITEMMLALGLEDRVVLGTTEGELLPQFQKAYEKVPHQFKGHHFNITKEAFLLMQPDFVSGFPTDIKVETTGSPQELLNRGIKPFLLEAISKHNATLEDVYGDFRMLGKIFNVEDKAKKIIGEQKERLKNANLIKPKTDAEKPKVMIMSSISNGVWIYSSLVTDLVNKAHGVNIYSDVLTQYELVTYESILHRNPDVIFMADIQSKGVSVEEKINTFKNDPILKNVTAVRNNNIHKMNLEDIYPGVRNADFIIRMNKILYNQEKK